MKYKYLISFYCDYGCGNMIWESDGEIEEEDLPTVRREIEKSAQTYQNIIILNIIKLKENNEG